MYYTSALGLSALREAIAGFYRTRYGVEVPASRVIVTAGSSAALLLAFGVLLDDGDEVLLADPGYPCNRHFVRTLGGVPRGIAVGPENRYQLTASLARRHWGPRTRMAMVASPANPTGTLVAPAELAGLAELARERAGTLLVDEIYQGLTYGVERADGRRPRRRRLRGQQLLQVLPDDRLAPGLAVAPPAMVRRIETLAQNLFISPSAVAQHAALACFTPETLAITEARRAELDERRRFLVPALESLGFRVPVVPEGAFLHLCRLLGGGPDSFTPRPQHPHRGARGGHAGQGLRRERAAAGNLASPITQTVTRLEEAVARIRKLIHGRS
jgi:aspartate/methionine/tyrosine aminotransferase